MANVSLAEKRVPLDGRINVQVGEKVIDLRVSTLPTVHGESIVMRILDKESGLGLPQLGFFSDDQSVFEKVINMPDGIFWLPDQRVLVNPLLYIPLLIQSINLTENYYG